MLRAARWCGKGELRQVGAMRADRARYRRLLGEKVGPQARREHYSGPLGRVAGDWVGAAPLYRAWRHPT